MQPTRAERDRSDDRIDEAIDESFPASDPPSWTLGRDHSDEPTLGRAMDSPRYVAGVFDDEKSASEAVYQLTQMGFDATREVGVVTAHRRRKADVPNRFRTGAGQGILLATPLFAVLGGVVALLMEYEIIPAAMGIADAGPGRALFTGVVAGAFLGFLIGALGGNAVFWTNETAFDRTDVRGGAVKVGVHTQDATQAEEALAALRRAGAKHFQT